MRLNSRIWPVVAGLVLACAAASYAGNASDKQIEALFVKSGMDQLLEQLPAMFGLGMEQAFTQDENLKKLPRHALEGIKNAAGQAYAPKKLTDIMIKSMSGTMSADEAASVLEWLDSPIGKKCTDLEKGTVTAEGMKEMEQFAQEIKKNPPPPERLKLIRELDRATNATATSVEVFMNTNLAVATAVTLSLPQETRRPLPDIKKQLEGSRPAIEKALEEQTLVSMLFTYRKLTDRELLDYVNFARSPVGDRFNTVAIDAFQKAMVAGGVDFGQGVARVFENIHKKKDI